MDRIPKIGNIITDEAYRDAVHIAVAPVIAGMELYPGEHIGFIGNAYTVGTNAVHNGIVDPYLTDSVKLGQRFYMFLYPNTITSLRHEWTHPSFEKEDTLSELEPTFLKLKGPSEQEKWIAEYAVEIGSDYDELMAAANDYLTHGDYLNKGDVFDGVCIPDEFWDKYESVTKKAVAEDDRGTFLSCSC